MKSKFLFFIAICGLVALSSCREENFGYSEEEIAYAKFEKEYNDNFEKDYGKIAAGHTWGFDSPSSLTRIHEDNYHHYRLKKQDNWDSAKSFKCLDGNNYAFEHEVGSSIDCNVGHNNNTLVLETDYKFVESHYEGPVQQPEKDYVNTYLIKHPNEGALTCDMGSYIIYNLGYLNKGANVDHMDELIFDDEHFQSYNGGSGYDYYVTNTDIRNPYYHDTQKTGDEFNVYNHYRFYYIPANPTQNFKGGLYLCFDYKDPSSGFDGIYNDWVLKIAPGEGETKGESYRVFCEDLGDAFDLDFNDLVFDYMEIAANVTAVHVIGLSGTLPLWFINIDGQGTNKVVRDKDDKTPKMNVDLDVFYINRSILSTDLIAVEGNKKNFPGIYNNNGNDVVNNGVCFIYNVPGKAPYMIRVPVGTEWPAERQRIENKYPNFPNYVVDPWQNPTWWNKF